MKVAVKEQTRKKEPVIVNRRRGSSEVKLVPTLNALAQLSAEAGPSRARLIQWNKLYGIEWIVISGLCQPRPVFVLAKNLIGRWREPRWPAARGLPEDRRTEKDNNKNGW